MNIHTVIRKYTVSQFADASYWGKFDTLTSLPLTDTQFLKLINFYSAAESFRTYVLNILTPADGYSYRFVSSPDSLIVYSHFGVLMPNAISEIIKTGPEFNSLVTKRDELFSELGWTVHEERIAPLTTEFDEENSIFSQASSTYQEIEDIYESAQPLTVFLGN
jgi:hypothetical protein